MTNTPEKLNQANAANRAYCDGFIDGFIAMARLHIGQTGSHFDWVEARNKYFDAKERSNGTN